MEGIHMPNINDKIQIGEYADGEPAHLNGMTGDGKSRSITAEVAKASDGNRQVWTFDDTTPEPVTGWRAWFPTWPSLIRCIGGAAAMNAWQFLPPGHDLIRWALPLYVAAWLAYEVWDGWYLRWAIPTIAVVAGLFACPYVTFAYRALILAAFWAYVAIWIVSLVRGNYRANRNAEPETRMTELAAVEHEDN
jgi:hypothetical protein